jgi:hypothetical protein
VVDGITEHSQRLEEKPSDGDLDSLCLDSQGHSSFSPDLKAGDDRLADIVQRFFTALALTDATGYRGAFGNPNTIFVSFQCRHKLHFFHVNRFDRLWEALVVLQSGGN